MLQLSSHHIQNRIELNWIWAQPACQFSQFAVQQAFISLRLKVHFVQMLSKKVFFYIINGLR